MYEAIVIDVSSQPPIGKGAMKFKYMPRVGEWVQLDEKGLAVMYLVVMIAHSTSGGGVDLYVTRLKETPGKLIQQLTIQ